MRYFHPFSDRIVECQPVSRPDYEGMSYKQQACTGHLTLARGHQISPDTLRVQCPTHHKFTAQHTESSTQHTVQHPTHPTSNTQRTPRPPASKPNPPPAGR